MNCIIIKMKTILSAALFLFSTAAYSQAASANSSSSILQMDTNTILIILALFLLIPLWVLSNTFITAAKHFYAGKLKSKNAKVLLPIGLIMVSTSLWGQEASAASTAGLSAGAMTILLLCVIGAELLLILYFARRTNEFIRRSGAEASVEDAPNSLGVWLRKQWTAMNFKPIEEEHKIDTGHDYDGIRELDNIIPPWFTTAFLLTILFAAVYLYRYHIAKSAPLQIEEFKMEMAMADLQHDEYLKGEANSINESNVSIMTGADLDAGKKTFVTLCAACHKVDGGGMVGPNLTDDYTIHGGSLQDIFKTVKYGVPDKGMISWKDQLDPKQMAQVSNYILTLRGTNPPDAKEKQGELYVPKENVQVAADTMATPPDTTIVK